MARRLDATTDTLIRLTQEWPADWAPPPTR
jgi:hypothetical protein